MFKPSNPAYMFTGHKKLATDKWGEWVGLESVFLLVNTGSYKIAIAIRLEIPYNCMALRTVFMKSIDHSNIKYGHLTGIRRLSIGAYGATSWLWRCDCGVEKEILAKNVTNGNIKTCGKCQYYRKLRLKKRSIFGRRKPSYKVIRKYRAIMRRCRAKGISFLLNTEEFHDIIYRPCSICGTTPKWRELFDLLPADSAIGYALETSGSVCKSCSKVYRSVSISLIYQAIIKGHTYLRPHIKSATI